LPLTSRTSSTSRAASGHGAGQSAGRWRELGIL
jgi:hypothetical protein